jgi:hypothetical protein
MLAIISSLFTNLVSGFAKGATSLPAHASNHSPTGAVAIAPPANCPTLEGIDSAFNHALAHIDSIALAGTSAICCIDFPKSLLYHGTIASGIFPRVTSNAPQTTLAVEPTARATPVGNHCTTSPYHFARPFIASTPFHRVDL